MTDLRCKYPTVLDRECGREATRNVAWSTNATPPTHHNVQACTHHAVLTVVSLTLDCTVDTLGIGPILHLDLEGVPA